MEIDRNGPVGLRKKCGFPNCENEARSGRAAYCNPHYQQHRKGVPLTPMLRPTANKSCREPGCSEPAHAQGLCRVHYQIARRNGSVERILADNRGKTCRHPGCAKPAHVRGLCPQHTWRESVHGDTHRVDSRFEQGRSLKQIGTDGPAIFRGEPVQGLALQGLAAFPLAAVGEHKFLVQGQGWRRVAELKVGDRIGYPVRPITEEAVEWRFRLPTPPRGKRPVGPDTLKPSFELGCVDGLYVAEGCLARHPAEDPSAVIIAGHADDQSLIEGWLRSAGDLYSSVSTRRILDARRKLDRETHGVAVTGGGRSFAYFMRERCGETHVRRGVDTKAFPHNWHCYGEDHVRGMVLTYLFGDGHYDRDGHHFGASSKRAILAVQLRDMLASLGYGWAAIGYVEPSDESKYGRNQHGQWRPLLSGAGADALARELHMLTGGREKYRVLPRRRNVRNRVVIADGCAWVPIVARGDFPANRLEALKLRPDYLQVVGGFGVDPEIVTAGASRR